MKRLLWTVSVVLAIMMLALSCEFADKDTVLVPIPIFGETSADGRGLKTMPVEYFEDDLWLSCTVMTIMPTLTNLQAVEVSLSGNELKNIEANYTIFGFDIELADEYSHINSDGVYLSYKILYEDAIVGFCDYYYNIGKKVFSYRQSVCCTFNSFPDNEILNIEYTDIPIENVLEPVFEVGQLTDEGILASDAFVDNVIFTTYNTQSPTKSLFAFKRSFITMNEVRENDGLYTMYAFKQPDNSFETDWCEYEGELKAVKDVLVKYAGDDAIFNTDAERTSADFSMMKEIYPLIYENGESLSAHHSTKKGYTSYEEFKADSFLQQINMIKEKLQNKCDDTPRPVVYTYNGTNSKGATTTRTLRGEETALSTFGPRFRSGLIGVGDRKISEYSDEYYKKTGFEDYYGKYDSENETVTIYDFTARKHLKACGIEDEDYIDAFIEATKDETAETVYTERIKVKMN